MRNERKATLTSMIKYTACLVLTCTFLGCSPSRELDEEKSVQEIMTAPAIRNSDIVRNPISASQPADTINIPKIKFAASDYNFGAVKEGDIVEKTFTFTNVGKKPLLISNAKSTCGCTVPEWPKTPILPGEGGEISVRFNTAKKAGNQVKPVTITANTFPSTSTVYLRGTVNSNSATQ